MAEQPTHYDLARLRADINTFVNERDWNERDWNERDWNERG